jgi:NADH-quinone oxidoreductase subunit J
MYQTLSGLLFYGFAFVAVFAALMVISSRNPVHSVLFLILTFFSASGIFILIGAEFIAMTLVIVYVGAVAVLFLFVIMMLNVNLAEIKSSFSKYLPLGLLIASILLLDLMLVFNASLKNTHINTISSNLIPDPQITTNTHAIGKVLYTEYLYAFQISGLILLVAMISSIVLTLRQRTGVKKQSTKNQLDRDPKQAIKVINVPSGVGLDGMVN